MVSKKIYETYEGKYHLLISGWKHELIWANVGEKKIWEGSEEKLLGFFIERFKI